MRSRDNGHGASAERISGPTAALADSVARHGWRSRGLLALLVLACGCEGERELAETLESVAELAEPPSAEGDRAASQDPDTLAAAPAGLRAAYVRGRQREGANDARFHVTRERGRLSARSPEGQLSAAFGAEGMVLQSDAGTGGTLRAVSLRCGDTRVSVGHRPFAPGAAANRVERRVGGGAIEALEWVESGPLGLEQGFDVSEPQVGCDTLRVELEVQGLAVELEGDAVRLVGSEGALRYAQLYALDARGEALPSHFAVGEGRVELWVETRGAMWPLVVDPLIYTEDQRVSPPPNDLGSDGARDDRFGNSVALSSDGLTALVGARDDDVGSRVDQGAAYVLVRSGTTWTFAVKLLATDGVAGDQFGQSVSLSGDGQTAMVGSTLHDVGANVNQGAAYVFARSGSDWTQEALLVSADGATNDRFGASVSFSGDGQLALVGAAQDDVGSNVDQGSAYVFGRSGSSWTQQMKLVAGDGASSDQFGVSVSLSGDGQTALVGGYLDDVGSNPEQGSAYVFARSGISWSQQAKLVAGDGAASDQFGVSVSLSGDGQTALVGASFDDTGANSNQGAAYVFVRSGSSWAQQAKLVAGDGAASDQFGYRVSLSGDGQTALMGALGDDTGRGSTYVHARSGSSWTQQAKLAAGDGVASDQFGGSVSLSGDGQTALVGADLDAVGTFTSQGSVYVFVRSGGSWTQQAQLVSADGMSVDRFGRSVSLSGDGQTALVGAYGDDSTRGSAYVFVRSGSSWTQQAKVSAGDGATADQFGYSVSLSGDGQTALVGANLDDVGANANQGSAYVFLRSGSSWTQQAKLVAGDGAASDQFGVAVSLSGAGLVALVGAERDDSSRGSAYVFVRSGNIWTQQAKLGAGDGAASDQFGAGVSLSGDGQTALVGAYLDDVGALVNQGSAYVFVRSGSSWTQQAKLVASDGAAGDYFGRSVSLSGDGQRALVGAERDDSLRGSAYAFLRGGSSWTQEAKLAAGGGGASDMYGAGVALAGTTTLVGAPGGDGVPPYGNPGEGDAYFGTLLFVAADGEACSSDAGCTSGFCVDGVCCATECGGGAVDCQACAVAAGAVTDGVCGASTGNPCDDGLGCTSADTCSAGACGGASPCDAATSCTEASGSYTCSACPAGTYSADGSGAMACTPCAAGTWSLAGAMVCAAHTTCLPGSYVSAAGTSTSDQMCGLCAAGAYSATANVAMCTPCATGTYAAAGAASCATHSTCAAGTYVSAAGTSTEDRQCEPCAGGTYTSMMNATSCVPYTTCPAGSHVSTMGTPMSDQACEPCAAGTSSGTTNAAMCTACASGTYASGTGSVSCAVHTTCAVGTRVSGMGTPTEDRECEACVGGTYTSAPNSASCAAHTTCSAGTYVALLGTPMSDHVCEPCAVGTYSSTVNTASCAPHTTCPAGSHVSAMGTPMSDRTCEPCAAGTFSGTANTAMCVACGAGTYANIEGSASCAAHTTCTAGAYVSVAGTAMTDRQCMACAAETFTNGPNLAMCTGWTVCSDDEFEATPGTLTSDRMCAEAGACGSTHYEVSPPIGMMDRVCAPYTVCAEDEFQSLAPSGTSDRECTPITQCEVGEYESLAPSGTSDRECSACSTCGPGEFETAACAATTDTLCQAIGDAGVPDGGMDDDGGVDDDSAVDADGGFVDVGVNVDNGVEPLTRGGGCGCRASSEAPQVPSLSLLLGMVLGLWRRRQRCPRRCAFPNTSAPRDRDLSVAVGCRRPPWSATPPATPDSARASRRRS